MKHTAQPTSSYDSRHDAELAGMFGRRWEDLETFSPAVKSLFHILNYSCLLGNNPEFSDVPMLMSAAKNTGSEKIRRKAISALRLYVSDCSGTDQSLKPTAIELITSLGFEPYFTKGNTDEDAA